MQAHQLQPRRPATRRTRDGTRASHVMRGVNGNVRRLAAALPRRKAVAFFCECQNPTCYSAVRMSLTAFDAKTAAGGGWLLLAKSRSPEPDERVTDAAPTTSRSDGRPWPS